MPAASKISTPQPAPITDAHQPPPEYATVPARFGGLRLDKVLATLFPDHSRATLQKWVRAGRVTIDARPASAPRQALSGGEQICLAPDQTPHALLPEAMALDIVHQDDDIMVLNKPPGLVVHPGAGQPRHTLQNALLHHDPTLAEVPRAGLVHRLDKDTSGLLLVARTSDSHQALTQALRERHIRRRYEAIVLGELTGGGTVERPLGRHPRQRTRMAVRADGKSAITHYRILQRYSGHTHLEVELVTGRTHQIRVHLASLGHPVAGDQRYGGSRRALGIRRQALHAVQLQLHHPHTGQAMRWRVAVADDMQAFLRTLTPMTQKMTHKEEPL